MSLTYEYQEDPNPEDKDVLVDGLRDNARKHGMGRVTRFSLFLKENGNVLGGAIGVSLYGSLYVDILWVHEDLRGQGHGKALLRKAEELGKDRGCTFSTLTTMSWEALSFYQKMGYQIDLVREGFENDARMYYLKRVL